MRRIAFFALPIALFLAPAHAQTVSDGVKPSEERDFRLAQAQKAQALTVLEHVTADPGRGLFPEEVRAAESSVPDVVSAESRTDFRVRGFGGEVVNLPHPVTDGPCTPTADVLQFDGDYRVRMCYITGEGETGQAQAGVWASSQSGILWFFSRENAEVLVKVLDGCEYNGHRWVFVAPVTDLGFELRVTGPDGDTWTHTNEAGTTAPTKSDTSAFRCSSGVSGPELSGPELVVIPVAQAQKAQALTVLEHVTADPGRGLFPEEVRPAESSVPDVVSAESRTDFRVRGFGGEVVNLPHPVTDGPCTPTADVLQFDGDYRVRMCYITGEGETGQAQAGVWASSQSGILWFFSRENAEVLVKVLDGCEYNGHRWVFVAPVTDLGFELRVTGPDGDTWTHTNEAGTTAPTKSDTSAFRCSSEGTVPEFSGPEMVVIPAGSFEMGCVSGVRCRDNEFPVHSVTIPAPFAVGKYEVTFSEWDACVESGGCGHVPNDEGWGRDNRPVVGVSWEDAQEYVAWLSGETGFEYRLLSESEWEYAARAGTGTAYSWGNEIGRNRANCGGCSSPWELGGTAPVGSFAANAFGLHDMHGNVWEWVEDCWNESYVGAPSDGSAWLRGDCSERAFRGGSWGFGPSALRSAVRFSIGTGFRNNDLGFRVARTLTP